MGKIIRAAILGSLVLVSGCATASDDVRPTFQTAAVYDDLSCEQLAVKFNEVSKRLEEVAGKQDEKRKMDQAVTGVGVVVFWPALFLLATPSHKKDLAELKGTYEALSRAAELKRCKM